MAAETEREAPKAETPSSPFTTTTFSGINTPTTTNEAADLFWSDRRAVPSHGKTFQIIEKHSQKAITLVDNRLMLQSLSEPSHPDTHWLCVESNGYFGFQNAQTGRYMGHDGKGGVCASALKLDLWELWTPRQHEEGGYLLLSPHWLASLRMLCVEGDGSSLVRRGHGSTLWEFVRV